MQKEKIAFVVVRYGKDINGGAEYHCQMLAERLTSDYDVEVLTTCVRDVSTGENDFPEGVEYWNNVCIRRFKTNPINKENEQTYKRKARTARKWRRFLYQLRLLSLTSNFVPVWTYKQKEELKVMNSSMFYSSDLNDYIRTHKDSYKVFIAMSLDYPTFYYTALYAGEKTIGIPTMHYVGISFYSLLTCAISRIAYVGFNTEGEQKLGEGIFGRALGTHGIISVGIETPVMADWELTRSKYNIPDDYLLYIGRITAVKLYRLLPYFLNYKRKYKDSLLKLVLVGGGREVEKINHPDIIYTGFVSDEEKTTILSHSKIVVNPSNGESLSLILLEAMNQKKPVLVNGHCKVLKEHCFKSNFASVYYMTKRGFCKKLRKMELSQELRKRMGEDGEKYVEENYNWNLIMTRLKSCINNLKK